MSQRRLGISLPVQEQLSVSQYQALANCAEAVGYDYLSMGEIAGPEVFSVLGSLATMTSSIHFGTGVVPYNTRSPAYLAMAAATLSAMAPGRFFLGVGSSSRAIVEGWHGSHYSAPLAAFRSFMAEFDRHRGGRMGGIEDPALTLVPRGGFDAPLWLAAIGPKMLFEAGRLADGAYLAFCPVGETERRVERAIEGLESSGRRRDDFQVAVSLNAYAGPHVHAARERMSKFLETYSQVPTHRRGIDKHEWQSTSHKSPLGEDSRRALVDSICAVGDSEEVGRRVTEYWEAGVDVVFLHLLGLHKGDVHSAMGTAAGVAELFYGRGSE